MVDIASIKSGAGTDKAKLGKAPKIRLTKEQSQYVQDLVKLENRIQVCREYIALWMDFFRFLAEDLTEREIATEEEKGFFQVSTQLARKHFLFVEMMGDTFERGQDIVNVLATAVSLGNIQGMNENTRGKLELDWHSLYLDMNKALGRLLRMVPSNMTLSQTLEALANGTFNATDKKKKKK